MARVTGSVCVGGLGVGVSVGGYSSGAPYLILFIAVLFVLSIV